MSWSTDYPNYTQWQAVIDAQARGFALWCAFVVLLLLPALWIYHKSKRPDSNARTATRIIALAIFYLSFFPLSRPLWPLIPMAALLATLAYSWRAHLRRPCARWVALLVAAVAVRLPLLFESLWYDETFTAAVSARPFADMLTIITKSDLHPPGWYSIEWVIIRLFGNSEIALRAPALVCGLLLIPLTYRLARDLFGQDVAWWSAVLIAILPGTVYYSAEARTYALLACLCVGMMIAAVENRPVLFTFCALSAIMLHNLACLWTAWLGLIAFYYNRPQFRRWFLAGIPVAVVAGLWFPIMRAQSQDISNGFWLTTSPAALLSPLGTLTVGDRVNDAYMLHITAAIATITALSLVILRKWFLTSNGKLWLLFLLAVPASEAVVSFVWNPVYLHRTFLASAVVLVMAWAYLLTKSYSGDRLIYRLIILPMLAVALVCTWQPERSKRPAFRQTLAEACRGADAIYNTSIHIHFVTSYYSDLPQVLWTEAGDINQELTPEAIRALGWTQGTLDDLRGQSVCVLDFQTLLNRQSERDYIQQIIAGQTGYYIIGNTLFSLNGYVLP